MAPRLRSFARFRPFAFVALGGFAGASLRYAVAVALPASFPWGTLAANVSGCFLLAVLLYERRLGDRLSAETRLVFGTGFCSSFTTYSTFAAETAGLPPHLAAANVAANYGFGLLAVVCGGAVARWLS
jgi:CrcB protein